MSSVIGVPPRGSQSVPVPSPGDLRRAREVVSAFLTPTPLIDVTVAGRGMAFKLDSLQPTGSFKVRGALAALDDVATNEPGRAVVACSAGNHGLGIAFAAERLGVESTIVVPESASAAKVAALREFDVELHLHGATYGDAEIFAMELAASRSARFVSPYNDTHVIAGQSTMAAEILEQWPEAAHLVVAVGGGGLAAGSALALEGHLCRLHGAQVEQNAVFTALYRGEDPSSMTLGPTVADGIAGGIEPGAVTLDLLAGRPFDLTLVSEAATVRAMRSALSDVGVVAEGSAAVAIAAACARWEEFSGPVVVAITGRNVTAATLREVLDEH